MSHTKVFKSKNVVVLTVIRASCPLMDGKENGRGEYSPNRISILKIVFQPAFRSHLSHSAADIIAG